ncbi:MAG: PH domain-containing protein [FCB group bacterium]|nr:PH domain-containing protein [FCB group bacterium]
MEKSIHPDNKYYTAQLLVLATISGFCLLTAGVIQFILSFSEPDPIIMKVIWLVSTGSVAALWIVSFPIIYFWIKNLKYVIHDDRITIHKGILTKKYQNIPYRSITDFVLKRGLYERLLGIGSVQIQTAGQSPSASGYEGSLSGLREYDVIHTELRNKIKSLHPVSISASADDSKPTSDADLLVQILDEVRQIRKNTATKP